VRDLPICSLQNGWGNLQILAGRIPESRLLAGATSIGAYLDDAGCLHESADGLTVIAPWRPADASTAERAVAFLRRAGLRAESRPDALAVVFRKLLLNSAVNPVTALANRPNRALLDEPALFRIAERAALEAARVGWRLNLLPRDFDAGGALRAILSETRGNRSSMLEDLTRGRRTEIEEIAGAMVGLAAKTGEVVPVQRALLALVRAAEGRGPSREG
jgi:2-dehydropantoate 2-reductase